MQIPTVDIFIPAAPKDYSKLPFIVEAARRHVRVRDIHVCVPTFDGVPHVNHSVSWHLDDVVMPYDKSALKYRPSWCYQQFLKMFQTVTRDWYLVIDADTYMNRDIPLFAENGNPILWIATDQPMPVSYYNFNQQMLGYGRSYSKSFLSECTLYHRPYVRDMISLRADDLTEYWSAWVKIINGDCLPADAELYGTFMTHNYPDVYEIRQLLSSLGGRYDSHIWTEQEIMEEIESKRATDNAAHIFSLHSWEGKV